MTTYSRSSTIPSFRQIGLTHEFQSYRDQDVRRASNINIKGDTKHVRKPASKCNQPNEPRRDTVSLLSLICPGSKNARPFGTARKIATRTESVPKKDVVEYQGGESDLKGCRRDNQTIAEWADKASGKRTYMSMSDQSISDAQLTMQTAEDRITKWMKTPGVTLYLFYFSGHGSKDGIGLRDGIFKYSRMVELMSRDQHTTVFIVLDCCYAGGIVTAIKCTNTRKTQGIAYYACQEDEISVDSGLSGGGYFTSTYFGKGSDIKCLLHHADAGPQFERKLHHVQGRSVPQSPGCYKFPQKGLVDSQFELVLHRTLPTMQFVVGLNYVGLCKGPCRGWTQCHRACGDGIRPFKDIMNNGNVKCVTCGAAFDILEMVLKDCEFDIHYVISGTDDMRNYHKAIKSKQILRVNADVLRGRNARYLKLNVRE